MQASSLPTKFPIPFANGAGGSFRRTIPVASQIGISPGAASFTDGFPPVTFSPTASGGDPPFGQDFNGLLYEMTAWDQWTQAGGPVFWDSAFSTAIGGYPMGAIVRSNILAGAQWLSTADNNTSNPDAFGTGWIVPPGQMGTGFLSFTPTAVLPTGWTWGINSWTIGNAASGANYANANAVFLYVWFWNGFSNTQCAVTGGRGANALADFNAGKPLTVFDLSGTSAVGADASTGRLTGVPAVSGNISTPGSIIGENLHPLIAAENGPHAHASYLTDPGHTHSYTASNGGTALASSFPGGISNASTTGSSLTNITLTNVSQGSGSSHNTVARSVVGNWIWKL